MRSKDDPRLWPIVDALAEEMPGAVTLAGLVECRAMLAEQGVEMPYSMIMDYRIVGQFLEASTVDQRRLFRSQPVSTIQVFAKRGASQEYAETQITRHQNENSTKRMGAKAAKALFAQPAGSEPEEWTAEQWDAFDREVIDASEILITARNLRHRGIYEPSAGAAALLALGDTPQDLDSELASLLDEPPPAD